MMKKIEQKNYRAFISWAKNNTCNRVYPLSIAQNIQSGDIFSDDVINPKTVLFWHYCGFAYITGSPSAEILNELVSDICDRNRRRLTLITDDDFTVRFLKEKGYEFSDRIEYSYDEGFVSDLSNNDTIEISRIDESNIHKITGNIVPAFSWEEKRFLQNGFGYAAFIDGKFGGVAFSSAVSSSEIDIGVEVESGYRGRGIATTLARRMCEEIIAEGKRPVWAHAASNTGSMKTALKCGFIRKKINRFCLIKQKEGTE